MSCDNKKFKSINDQTPSFLKRPDAGLIDRIQQLKDEIVKVSHEPDPDLALHRFLMNQLKKAQQKLIDFKKKHPSR